MNSDKKLFVRHFDGLIVDLRRDCERALDDHAKSTDRALRIQAAEYARRLESLNHDAERLEDAVNRNVSSDTWDGFLRGYEERHSTLERRQAATESFQARLLGAFGVFAIVMPIATAVIVHWLLG